MTEVRVRWRGLVISSSVLVALVWTALQRPASAQGDRQALRPGLVAAYRDGQGAEFVQLEPTVALSLGPGESPHPRLKADSGTARWEGYLNVTRAADYRFSALVRGTFRLTVSGKAVLDTTRKSEAPLLIEGAPARLEAGVHPLAAEFTRLPGVARVQLWWQAPHFYKEPLPHTAVRHLPAKAPGLAAGRALERGRFLVEEMNCTACHRPAEADRMAKGLLPRQAPDLSAAGGRVHAGWIYHWLTSDLAEHPGRSMPRMFPGDEVGHTEAYAVTAYLESLGGPLRAAPLPQSKFFKLSVERGRRLLTTTGCIVCHQGKPPAGQGAPGSPIYTLATGRGSVRNYPLAHVAAKTTPEKLAAYLANPLATDPSGRMPHMVLTSKEAADLANFLCSGRPAKALPLPAAPARNQLLAAFQRTAPGKAEADAFSRLPADGQWRELGRRLVSERRCNTCHTVAPAGKPLPVRAAKTSFDDLKRLERDRGGCLAPDSAKRGTAPHFLLSDPDREAVRAFLEDGTRGPGTPSPAHAARVALQRFNCLACHARDGEGGLTPGLVTELRVFEKAEDAEAFTPPPLTGVGDKLRTRWLRQVLTEAGRARPWMGLRMPQFGAAHAGKLPEALAALDGTVPDEAAHKVALTAARVEAGRKLTGKTALGCISCHDIAGIPNPGTRGPDLALVSQRLRYDWYRRWMESAQRMQPGTKMPTVFPDGRSLMDNILGGSPDAQSEAIWAYLSLGPTLPLPEGLEPAKGLVVEVKGRPELVRTFLPDAGSKAVAVGYPGGVSVAFDAQACRLAYAWAGRFLDVSPVWDGRGGAPAKVLGPRFWTAPAGLPWGVSESTEPPDFAAQARDPAFGGPVPEGKVFTGRHRLSFEGYALDRDGVPAFRYRIETNGKAVAVEERAEPRRGLSGVGVGRRFRLEVPAGRTVWLLAGESVQTPRWLSARGDSVPIEAKGAMVEVPAAGRRLVLGQGGGQVTVLAPVEVPAEAVWHLRREGGTWKALLRLPPRAENGRVPLLVEVWSPWRDDPTLLKGLASQR